MAGLELELWLRRDGADVVVTADDEAQARVRLDVEEVLKIPGDLTPRRFARGIDRAQDTARNLAAIGLRLADLLAPATARLLAAHAAGQPALVRLCGDDFDLLALPWEAAQIGPHGPLGLLPGVRVVREVGPREPLRQLALPGPLRVLLVVATPHGDPDTADELTLLLNATADLPAHTLDAATTHTTTHPELELVDTTTTRPAIELVFLDSTTATLDALRARLDHEPFHVVHLAALSRAGALLLEDDDGRVAEVASTDLAEALAGARNPPPLVVLSTRYTGAALEGPGPMHAVEPMIHAGLPRVIAMQGTVDAAHAAELARELLTRLADPAAATPTDALAAARVAVEHTRRARLDVARTSPAASPPPPPPIFAAPHPSPSPTDLATHAPPALDPAYASPALFVARGLATCPLGQGDLEPAASPAPAPLVAFSPAPPVLGRRSLRRDLHTALARPGNRGALLVGRPGSGDEDLAHDVLRTLRHAGWTVVTHRGPFGPHDLAAAVVRAHAHAHVIPPDRAAHIHRLADREAPESAVLETLAALLAREHLVLVLADFAANLLPDGALPSGTRHLLERLARAADRGALLVLSERSFAGPGHLLTPLIVDPLPATVTEQWLRRSPALASLPSRERNALRSLDRPRTILLADALLRVVPDRWPAVRDRLADPTRDEILHAALRDTLDEPTRALLDVLVFLRPVPLTAVESVLPLTPHDWTPERRDAALATLVDRRLLLPFHRHRWRPLLPATGTSEAHLAAARWWRARLGWSANLEALAHLHAADSPEATALAEAMYTAARDHGHLLAGLALCDQLAVAWMPERNLWIPRARGLDQRRRDPVDVRAEIQRTHARAQAEAHRDHAGPARAAALVTADRDRNAALLRVDPYHTGLLIEAIDRLKVHPPIVQTIRTTAMAVTHARLAGDTAKARDGLAVIADRARHAVTADAHDDAARVLLAWTLLDLAELDAAADPEAAAASCLSARLVAHHGLHTLELRLAEAVACARHGALRTTSLADAAADLDRGIQHLRATPVDPARAAIVRRELILALARRGELDLLLGDSTLAAARLDEAADLAVSLDPAQLGDLLVHATVHLLHADVHTLLGDSDAALASLQAAHDRLHGPPGPRPLELARWRLARATAGLHLQRGALLEARAQIDLADSVSRPLLEREPAAPDLLRERAHTCVALGNLLRITEDPPAPQRPLEEALQIFTALPTTIPDRRAEHARVLLELAEYHRGADDLARAQAHAESARTLADHLGEADPERLDHRQLRAAARRTLAALALASGDLAAARRTIGVGRHLTSALATRDPARIDHPHDLVYFQILEAALHPGPAGERHLLDAHVLAQTIVRRDPGRADIHRRLWGIDAELGRRLRRARDPAGARPHHVEALALAEALVARHPDNDAAQASLAQSCADLAAIEVADAPRLLARAVAVQRARKAAAPHVASRTRDLAAALIELGKRLEPPSSHAAYHEARDLLRGMLPRPTPRDHEHLIWLAQQLGPP